MDSRQRAVLSALITDIVLLTEREDRLRTQLAASSELRRRKMIELAQLRDLLAGDEGEERASDD